MIANGQIHLTAGRNYTKMHNLNMADLQLGDRFMRNGRTFEVVSAPTHTTARSMTVELTTVAISRKEVTNALNYRGRYINDLNNQYNFTSLTVLAREDPDRALQVRNLWTITYIRDAIQRLFMPSGPNTWFWTFRVRTKVDRIVYRPEGDYTRLDEFMYGITHLISEHTTLTPTSV